MKYDIKALQLASRFSLPPNSLGYCGKDSAPERFKACIRDGVCEAIEEELTKFIVLNPYLETIKDITKLSKFSYKNIEAYWIGNNLLHQAKVKDYNKLLANFKTQGVPDWLVKDLENDVPNVFYPNHLFQVLHVGVGRASGSVPYDLNSINNCMVRWGKVSEIAENHLLVDLNTLKIVKNKYVLFLKKETPQYSNNLTINLKVGDIVAVHWGFVVKILNLREEKALATWTKKIMSQVKPKVSN